MIHKVITTIMAFALVYQIVCIYKLDDALSTLAAKHNIVVEVVGLLHKGE